MTCKNCKVGKDDYLTSNIMALYEYLICPILLGIRLLANNTSTVLAKTNQTIKRAICVH